MVQLFYCKTSSPCYNNFVEKITLGKSSAGIHPAGSSSGAVAG